MFSAINFISFYLYILYKNLWSLSNNFPEFLLIFFIGTPARTRTLTRRFGRGYPGFEDQCAAITPPRQFYRVFLYLLTLLTLVFVFLLYGTQVWLKPLGSIVFKVSIQYFSRSFKSAIEHISMTSKRNPRLDLFHSFCIILFGWCLLRKAVKCSISRS